MVRSGLHLGTEWPCDCLLQHNPGTPLQARMGQCGSSMLMCTMYRGLRRWFQHCSQTTDNSCVPSRCAALDCTHFAPICSQSPRVTCCPHATSAAPSTPGKNAAWRRKVLQDLQDETAFSSTELQVWPQQQQGCHRMSRSHSTTAGQRKKASRYNS